MQKLEKLLSSEEAAEFLGLDEQTVRDLARLGQIRGRKTKITDSNRGHWRFEKTELIKWSKQYQKAQLK